MGYSNILIDTSIIIDYLRKENKINTLFWDYINHYRCSISTITLFELYCGAKDDKKKEEIELLTSFLEIVPFDLEQSKIASDIFRNLKKINKLIEYRDIFIASCAISKDIPLATLNTKHFIRIDSLDIL